MTSSDCGDSVSESVADGVRAAREKLVERLRAAIFDATDDHHAEPESRPGSPKGLRCNCGDSNQDGTDQWLHIAGCAARAAVESILSDPDALLVLLKGELGAGFAQACERVGIVERDGEYWSTSFRFVESTTGEGE